MKIMKIPENDDISEMKRFFFIYFLSKFNLFNAQTYMNAEPVQFIKNRYICVFLLLNDSFIHGGLFSLIETLVFAVIVYNCLELRIFMIK